MTVVSLDIIEEFLRSPDPQLRKNGLTALGVIARPDTIDRLVEVSFADPDPAVRERAESEMARLQGDTATGAAEAAVRQLANPQREMAAYQLLSRLARSGWAPEIPGSLRTRASRALRLARTSPVVSTIKVRAILVGLVGAGCFSLFVWAFAVGTTRLWPAFDEAIGMTFAALLLGWPVAGLVFAWHVPLYEQADPRVASLVGLLQTAVIAGVVGLLLLLLVYANTAPSADVLASWFGVLATGVAAAVAARLGADAVGGRVEGSARRLAMAGVGSVLGTVVAIAGLLASGALSGDASVAEAPNLYFLPIVVSAAVIACATAAFEVRPPVTAPAQKQVSTVAVTVAALSVVLGFSLAVSGPSFDPGALVQGATMLGPAPRDKPPLEHRFESPLWAHMRVAITVDFDQLVRINTSNPGGDDLELRIVNTRTAEIRHRIDDPDPPTFSGTLPPGTYLVEVGRYGTFSGSVGGYQKLPVENILSAAFAAWAAPRGGTDQPASKESGTFSATVVLNAPPES